jgi:hypothetical protein
MITTVALVIALSGTPAQSPQGKLSEAISRYFYAANVSGSIAMTISLDGTPKSKILTDLQFSTPNKLYLNQKLVSGQARDIRMISDGEFFAYTAPEASDRKNYVYEPIRQRNGELLDVRSLYSIITALIPDRSIPLDMIMGRPADLQTVNQLLSNYEDGGTREYNGEMVSVILCRVRPNVNLKASMKGAFFINAAGDIRYFKSYERTIDGLGREVDYEIAYEVKVKVDDREAIRSELYNLDLIKK